MKWKFGEFVAFVTVSLSSWTNSQDALTRRLPGAFSRCLGRPGSRRPDMCRANLPRFYYSPTLGRCELVFFGGCVDDGQSFRAIEDCRRECEGACDDAVGVPGTCKARLPRYAYNPRSRDCELFFYSGCRGNNNNFLTYQQCARTCRGSADSSTSDSPGVFNPLLLSRIFGRPGLT